MRRLIVHIAMITLSLPAFTQSAEEAQILFEQGNAAYEQNDFEGAHSHYLSIGEGFSSFEYHYNLGNTYYKLDSIPQAILHYEKAALVDPGDEDLVMNLKIANQRVKDKIEALPSLGVENLWDRVVSTAMLKTWTWTSILCWAGALALLGFFFFSKSLVNRRFYGASATVLVIVAILSFSLGIATNNRIAQSSEAVIMSPKVDVMNQPNGSQIEFVLHEGTKVQLRTLSLDGQWREIRIASGGIGWMKVADLREI